MFKSKILILVLVQLLALQQISSYLVTQKKIDQLKNLNYDFVEAGNGDLQIPETTCNVVDVTNILPTGMTNDQFVVRSGFNKMGKGNSAFGFIFYGAMAAKGSVEDLKNYPTLIWLQGGPGGSSQFGNFKEMGPILVTGESSFTYTYNKYSWNQEYNMIFIDNPIGTGLSYAETFKDIPKNQKELAKDFLAGLTELYTSENGCFAQLGLTESPLVITGESYAGKYVPNFAHHIVQQEDDNIIKKALLKGGIAVGDGFTDPKTIMDILPIWGYNMSWLNQVQRDVASTNARAGDVNMEDKKWISSKQMFDSVMNDLSNLSGVEDPYNFANTSNKQDDLNLTNFLDQESVKTGVFQFPAELAYRDMSLEVYMRLSNDFMQYDVVSLVQELLQTNFPIMYYNGQNDVIVCTPCTETWLDKLVYYGDEAFQAANFQTWNTTMDGSLKVSGYFKQSQNLIFTTVNQAGHMVPSDQPEGAYNMISSYVNYLVNRPSADQPDQTESYDREQGIFSSFNQQANSFNKKSEKMEQQQQQFRQIEI